MKKNIFLILSIFLFALDIYSQIDTISIGGQSSSLLKKSDLIPFNGKYDYSWSTAIYTKEQLVGLESEITQIGFYISNNTNYLMRNQKIYARLTSSSTPDNSNFPDLSSFTLVYSGDILYTNAGWKYIIFNTPLIYESGQNVEFLFENRDGNNKDNSLNGNQSINNNPRFGYLETNTVKGNRDYKDKMFPQSCYMCESVQKVPIIKIPFNPCKSFPAGNVSVSASGICSGSSLSLYHSINNPNSTGYNTIEWYVSTDQTNWTLVSSNSTDVLLNQSSYNTQPLFNLTQTNITYFYKARIIRYNNSESVPYCEKTTSPVSVTVYPKINVLISMNGISIPQCFSPTINLTTDNLAATSYSWNLLGSTNNPISTNQNLQFDNTSLAGFYQLVIKDINGCTAESNTIQIYELPNVSILATKEYLCSNTESSILTANVIGGGGNYVFSWQDISNNVISGATTNQITISTSGTYYVTVIDGNMCANSVSMKIKSSSLTANAGADAQLGLSNTLGGNPVASGGTGNYSYLWSPNQYFELGSNNTLANPTVVLTGSATYTLTVLDLESNCSAIDEINLYEAPAEALNNTYANLTRHLDAGYYSMKNKKLYFTIDGEYKTSNLIFKIYNEKHILQTVTSTPPLIMKNGDNRFELDLSGLTLANDVFYCLEVINEKKEKFYLKFKND